MDSNNTEDDILSLNYGKSYPSVTLRYKVVNGTSDDTDGLSRYNNCTQAIWTNFSATEPQSAKKADSHMEVDIELTLVQSGRKRYVCLNMSQMCTIKALF